MPPYSFDKTRPIVGRQSTVSSTPLPLVEILSLAIGAPTFFAILVLLTVYYLRRKHHRAKSRLKEGEKADLGNQLGVPLHATRTPEICISQRSSFNPFLPPIEGTLSMSNDWLADDSMIDSPPAAKTRPRKLSQKGLLQISGIRDSWPMGSEVQMPNMSLPLGLVPTRSIVTLNQVAPPGYIVPPETKWPRRSYTRDSRARILVLADESKLQRLSTRQQDIGVAPNRPMHERRSVSENHLSTILRSTSQRLKASHKHSLSRQSASFGRSPGPPPTAKLKTPNKAATESRDDLIEPEYAESVVSSIYDAYLNRTPSPTRKVARSSGQAFPKRTESPTPSAASDDSLCAGVTPDLVIPAALTSPSKRRSKSPQRHAMRTLSAGSQDFSAIMQNDSQGSMLAHSPERKAAFNSLHRLSLAGDPFYSSVKSAKPIIPQNKIIGPRPLYIRKATFGQEATTERPSSFVSISSSPLRNISGNAQSPSKPTRHPSPTSSPTAPESNVFLWSPQEAMQTRVTQPISTGAGSRRIKHKRSNVVRLSLVPRPPSVCPVPEESEEDFSHLKTQVWPQIGAEINEPVKNAIPKSTSTSSCKISPQPPSIATFDPLVPLPGHGTAIGGSVENSTSLVINDPPQIYSPTLSIFNYYTESPTSETEFFKPESFGTMTTTKSHQKKSSISVVPKSEPEELVSFPPLSNSTTPAIFSPTDPEQQYSGAKSARKSVSSMLMTSVQGTPAPPLLTEPLPIPGHLTSPRSQTPKWFSKGNNLNPRESLHQSICMLRRMNSEVSRCSTISVSSLNEEGDATRSPVSLWRPSPDRTSWGLKERRDLRQGRGSKHYLSLGTSFADSPKRRVGKRDSASARALRQSRIIRENIREVLVEDDADMGPEMENASSPLAGGAKTMDSGSSKLQFPTVPIHGRTPAEENISAELSASKEGGTQEFGGERRKTKRVTVVRWSDAMSKATIRAVRHESQIQHPSPTMPHRLDWIKGETTEPAEDAKENIKGGTENYGNWNGNNGRPDSLGLYDCAGFLKCSPEKPMRGSISRI